VVESRVGAKERQAETVLPLDRSVTGTRIATEAAKKRRDVPAEARRGNRPRFGTSGVAERYSGEEEGGPG
jgi:hypothetical protein